MKFSKLLKNSALITAVTVLITMAMAVVYDYDYEVSEFFTDVTSSQEEFEFFITLSPAIFVGSFFIMWGFWRTELKRKIYAVLIFFIVSAGLYVNTYYDSLYFEYVSPDSPYDGYFIRDAIQDDQSDAHKELRVGNPIYYYDTIGKTSLLLEKQRARLGGNRSPINTTYNVCIHDDKITFVAVVDFFDTGDYCKPQSKAKVHPVEFTLKPIAKSKYLCQGCENYLLPMYWEFIGER